MFLLQSPEVRELAFFSSMPDTFRRPDGFVTDWTVL